MSDQPTWDPATVAVGDLGSAEIGSGARFNAGKVPVELMPQRIIARMYEMTHGHIAEAVPFITALDELGKWQEGGDESHLYACLNELGTAREVAEATAWVFDYGRRKYAEWNWAKGMAWSIPMACSARHLYDLIEGKTADHESNLPLIGHVACNIMMLITYHRTFLSGDNRTPYLRA